ncbi:hypothetical protein [Mesorhizobium sp. M7A.F.Ca.ET.027.03.2.1]|uniref:hypothetical protein n=1 Tax=Mesorhizobium sp. M7A.F.Ca.ET.027.03.2.1 TaxID=2496656 RepID=UPI000FCA5178|nr:hypothetical protein [Mesorhizobium sp. M7A.F.Ca.ET.027.03.2.1]RVD66408.1 hypothetical protein EN750_03595 [Mesorhizobium sp. M7A.F.Ca.ET.027.03.2.1]
MTKASLGAGNVHIQLDGETVTLRPTLKAAQAISRQAGGLIATLKGLSELDLDVVTGVIAAGLGRKTADIEDEVFRTGVVSLIPGATAFIGILANGGRPSEAGGSGEENPPRKTAD